MSSDSFPHDRRPSAETSPSPEPVDVPVPVPSDDHAGGRGTGPEPGDLVARAEKLSRRNSFWVGVAMGVVVATAATLLIVQNGGSTRLRWVMFSFDAPLWIFLALILAVGAMLGWAVPLSVRRGRRRHQERRRALREAREALADRDR